MGGWKLSCKSSRQLEWRMSSLGISLQMLRTKFVTNLLDSDKWSSEHAKTGALSFALMSAYETSSDG